MSKSYCNDCLQLKHNLCSGLNDDSCYTGCIFKITKGTKGARVLNTFNNKKATVIFHSCGSEFTTVKYDDNATCEVFSSNLKLLEDETINNLKSIIRGN